MTIVRNTGVRLLLSSVSALLIGLAATAQAGISVSTLSLEHDAQPGDVYSGTVTVTNSDSIVRYARIYQTDYRFFSDGSNQFGDPGMSPRSNARWIRFSPRRVELPPGLKSDIGFEVQVPEDNLLSGTYWSLIMVEEDPEAGQDSLPPLESNEMTIHQLVRYGIQCITHIGTTAVPELHFTDSRLVLADNQNKQLEVSVENTGSLWAVPIVWIELYDMDGHQLGKFKGEKKRIFPGTSVCFHIKLGEAPSGKYKALVILDGGDQNIFGAKYDLEF